MPSHRYRGVPEGEHLLADRDNFAMCLPLISLIFDEERQINPPAFASLRHPPSTREGGARLSAFLFPHGCLVRIVQDDDFRRPKAAEWSGSPLGELAPEASEGGGVRTGNWKLQWKTDRNDRFFESILPFQALRASFPGGKPSCLPIFSSVPRLFLSGRSLSHFACGPRG